jgi:hypothetical protein
MGTIKGSSHCAIDRHKLVREKFEYRDDFSLCAEVTDCLD